MDARRLALKAHGKCTNHPKRDVAPGRTVCQECLDSMRDRRKRCVQNGSCPQCGNSLDSTMTRCTVCTETNSQQQSARYTKRKERGLCITCGKKKPRKRLATCAVCARNYRKAKNTPEARAKRKLRRVRYRFQEAQLIAKRRDLAWSINEADYLSLIALSCHYCHGEIGPTGIGLDRKDNRQGYSFINVVPCCKLCNVIKGSFFTYEEMLEIAVVIRRVKRRRVSRQNA